MYIFSPSLFYFVERLPAAAGIQQPHPFEAAGELFLAGAGDQPGEVVLHVLEDEVEAAGHARVDEAIDLDDAGVVEAAEDEERSL